MSVVDRLCAQMLACMLAFDDPRHAADPRNIYQGASMKIVVQCTRHRLDENTYLTERGAHWGPGFAPHYLGSQLDNAAVFESPTEALAAIEAAQFMSKHDFAFVLVEVTPPTPGSVRRLI